MSEIFPRTFSAKTLSTRLETLRNRGRQGLLAALGAPEAPVSPELPKPKGEALAKHHLALALEACRDAGTSKPQAFAKLRLLINGLEQGRLPTPTTVSVPKMPESSAMPTPPRRSRLLSRAFHSANQIAEWRKGSADSQSALR
ncbi:MAG: hypothetical protein GY811_02590 [Myxococcales bacterium]|nr:hypothetical protein [Myxococcales bacterium]